MGINEVYRAIKKYDNFLITVHTSPEGDALGAQLGFYNLLRRLGKKAAMLNDDWLPASFDFLPGASSIRRLSKGYKPPKIGCLAVLDCADLKRAGAIGKLFKEAPVLNIDHHVSNQCFGQANWVDARASSCSEMIYRLYKKFRMIPDKDTALALYTGIMTDTGSFRYSNTASSTFKAAAELLKTGINVAWVYRRAYENIPPAQAKLLLKLLSGIKFFGGQKIAAFTIGINLPEEKDSADLVDHVLSFGRSINGVEVVVLFKHSPGAKNKVRVNLRSQGLLDVNKIAAFFGGGGHRTAAGCTLTGSINAVQSRVVGLISRELKKVI